MESEDFKELAEVAKGRDTLTTIRINGRLAWRVSDLRGLLSGGLK